MFGLLRRVGWLLRVGLLVLFLVVAYLGVTFVQVWQASRRDEATRSEAIVVLGAAQYNGDPSPVFEARLDHAAELWHQGIAPIVVVTGGRAEGDRFSEATAGANHLIAEGVPEASILRETSGRNSWESLAASKRFLAERGIDEVVLVSDPFHAARIDAIADEVGLEAGVSPTRSSPIKGAEAVQRMVGETFRVGVGQIIGFRRLMSLREVGVTTGP